MKVQGLKGSEDLRPKCHLRKQLQTLDVRMRNKATPNGSFLCELPSYCDAKWWVGCIGQKVCHIDTYFSTGLADNLFTGQSFL